MPCARRCRCRRTFPSAARPTGTACSTWRPSRRASARLRITSNLAGLELKLPEPLAKPAGKPLPSSLDVQWPASGGAQVQVALGSVLRGALILDSGARPARKTQPRRRRLRRRAEPVVQRQRRPSMSAAPIERSRSRGLARSSHAPDEGCQAAGELSSHPRSSKWPSSTISDCRFSTCRARP